MTSWSALLADGPCVMGILNVTPDSFSDGGRFADASDAVAAGLEMHRAGAAIIDVGGESTRPGAERMAPAAEQARVIPVVRALAEAGVVVSADTRNAATMDSAIDAGAQIINDVSALAHDRDAAAVVARRACAVILMHMRGTPATMMSLAHYSDVVQDVAIELGERVAAAEAAGISRDAIALDPGIGFAKRAADNVAVLRGLARLGANGLPLVVGLSRKNFIGRLTTEADPARRLGGSIAGALFAVLNGAAILRVHDVEQTVQALRIWRALAGT